VLNQGTKVNVFYSNGNVEANQAWMLTRHLGYKNNFVLTGGLNYWVETILNPTPPKKEDPDEEYARYDFRRAAGQALGGELTRPSDSIQTKTTTIKPPSLQKVIKKKKVQGGC
jgi:hypothetical protein